MSKLLLIAALAFLGWMWWRGKAARQAEMGVAEARALLGVPAEADAAEIHAAYRRITARVHPDAGGSTELARRVKIARDVLVGEVNRKSVPKL